MCIYIYMYTYILFGPYLDFLFRLQSLALTYDFVAHIVCLDFFLDLLAYLLK